MTQRQAGEQRWGLDVGGLKPSIPTKKASWSMPARARFWPGEPIEKPLLDTLFLCAWLQGCVLDWSVHPPSDAGADSVRADDGSVADAEPVLEGAACLMQEAPNACEAGKEVACMTSCGSRGRGTCSEDCRPPAEDACTVPAETCNRVDDDCDGLADEGAFWSQEPPVFAAWTQAFDDSTRFVGLSMIELAPRPSGGAWLFYSGRYGSIRVAQLDDAGRQVASLSSLEDETREVGEFRVDAYDDAIALVTTEGAAPDAMSRLRVRLLRAEDLSPLGDFEPVSENMRTLRLFSASLLKDKSSTWRVLVVYGHVDPTDDLAVSLRMRMFSHDARGAYSLSVPVELAATVPSPFAEVVRMPCRDEWLLGTAAATTPEARLQRVSIDPELIDPSQIETLPGYVKPLGVAFSPEGCASDSSEIALAYVQDGRQRLRRWRTEHETGTVEVVGSGRDIDLGSALGSMRAVHWGGRWFVAGFVPSSPQDYYGNPTLLEVDEEAKTASPLPLFAPGGPDPGVARILGLFRQTHNALALLHTGERLTLAVTNGFDPDLSAPSLQVETAATEQVVAATYTLGCPAE